MHILLFILQLTYLFLIKLKRNRLCGGNFGRPHGGKTGRILAVGKGKLPRADEGIHTRSPKFDVLL